MAATPKGNGSRCHSKSAFLLRYRIGSTPKAGVLAAKRLYDSQARYPFPALADKFIMPLNASAAEYGFLKVTVVLQPQLCLYGISSPQITVRVSQTPCLHCHTLAHC